MWQAICDLLSDRFEKSVQYKKNRSLSGGCIHNAQLLQTDIGSFFLKLNRPDALSMFEAEAQALKAIRETGTVRCPEVILATEVSGQAVLVLEYIPMQSAQTGSMAQLGHQLAAMHKHTHPQFGWHINNHIGLTTQPNTQDENWVDFYRKCRLMFQMELARRKGLTLLGTEKLIMNLEVFFQDYVPVPALLHGDLWGGNVGFDEDGNPVLFDPASYYGDREADMAFTEMFGGFSAEFYSSYEEAYPLSDGYAYRKRLYNLYHELNHYNLFGGGYGSQAQETIRFLLGKL